MLFRLILTKDYQIFRGIFPDSETISVDEIEDKEPIQLSDMCIGIASKFFHERGEVAVQVPGEDLERIIPVADLRRRNNKLLQPPPPLLPDLEVVTFSDLVSGDLVCLYGGLRGKVCGFNQGGGVLYVDVNGEQRIVSIKRLSRKRGRYIENSY